MQRYSPGQRRLLPLGLRGKQPSLLRRLRKGQEGGSAQGATPGGEDTPAGHDHPAQGDGQREGLYNGKTFRQVEIKPERVIHHLQAGEGLLA